MSGKPEPTAEEKMADALGAASHLLAESTQERGDNCHDIIE